MGTCHDIEVFFKAMTVRAIFSFCSVTAVSIEPSMPLGQAIPGYHNKRTTIAVEAADDLR